jgi:hypothetical protein
MDCSIVNGLEIGVLRSEISVAALTDINVPRPQSGTGVASICFPPIHHGGRRHGLPSFDSPMRHARDRVAGGSSFPCIDPDPSPLPLRPRRRKSPSRPSSVRRSSRTARGATARDGARSGRRPISRATGNPTRLVIGSSRTTGAGTGSKTSPRPSGASSPTITAAGSWKTKCGFGCQARNGVPAG